MWEKIIGAAVTLRLPSIFIIAITFIAGINLITTGGKNQAATIAGCVILGIGGIAVIFSLADNLVKERYESIINHYEKALRSIGKTHSTFEETSRNNMLTTPTTGNQLGDKTYITEQPGTTSTS